MDFHIGDMVVYGIHGVCRIVKTQERMVDRKRVEYFVLEPIHQNDAAFFVPMHNPLAVGKLRRVLTRAEMTALLESEELRKDSWISNEAVRKEQYRALIAHADCAELIRMLRALYRHKQVQLASSKKLHTCDENFMKDAERVIRSEVSAVMEIPPEQVGALIRSKTEE